MKTADLRNYLIGHAYKVGVSLSDIADVFGISKQRVRQIVARQGIELRRPGRRPGPWRQRIERQVSGETG